jgi:hypothetical protein
MSYKIFVNGFPLNASELNEYLMNQVVTVFADSTARDAAIESPLEGQFCYLTGLNVLTYFNGSAWAEYTPTLPTSVVSNKASNYTTVAGDAGNTINSTSSAITITISNTLSAAQRIDFVQSGTGQITFAAGSGVTLNSKGGKLKSNGQYTAASVLCLGSGSYLLVGDLGA